MYRKIRFYFRLLLAFVKKYIRIFLLGLILGILGFFFIPKFISSLPQIRFNHKIAYVGRYTLTTLPLPVQQQISIGLTSIDPSGLPSPAVAKSWEATDSGKTYIFTLNEQLRWQDDTPLHSQDIKYNFRDAKIEYPDLSHLIIKLQDPFSPLPTILSSPIFKTSKTSGLFPKLEYYGLGPYKIQSYRKNGPYLESLSLSPTNISSRLPRLQYFFYQSEGSARTAFKLGIVDEISDLQELGELANWPNVSIVPKVQSDRYTAVFFNTKDPNFQGTAGKNLRMSLAYALDKSRWQNRVFGPISSQSWVYDPDLRHFDLDFEKAKTLLQKVEKVPQKIILSTTTAYLKDAEYIKSDWEKLGISIDIQVIQDIPDNFQVLLIAQSIPSDPDQYNYWHSTKSTNLTGINNPRIDKKLEDGRKTFDSEERRELYLDFQKTLSEEVAAIFLFNPQNYTLTRN